MIRRENTENKLTKFFGERPPKEQLMAKGIISTPEQKKAKKLIEQKLDSFLRTRRPTLEELQLKNIIIKDPRDATIPEDPEDAEGVIN